MTTTAPGEALEAGAAELGLSLPPSARDALLRYGALLLRWSRVHNLTAVRDLDEVLTLHLLDALSLVGPLRERWPTGAPRLLDVGSGGGVPAVPLAILLPAWRVVALDKVAKKVAFLTQVRVELQLSNLEPVHARVEAWQPSQRFDGIVSRAFASLDDMVRVTRHLLADDGRWFAMKGQRPDAELAQLTRTAPDVVVDSVVKLRVPRLAADRHLVILQRAAAPST